MAVRKVSRFHVGTPHSYREVIECLKDLQGRYERGEQLPIRRVEVWIPGVPMTRHPIPPFLIGVDSPFEQVVGLFETFEMHSSPYQPVPGNRYAIILPLSREGMRF